jgi:DNA-binding response OmpR family regulator
MKKRDHDFSELTILLTEEETSCSSELFEMLEGAFKACYRSSDGFEAYRLYELHNPDIILTDIDLSGMSGLDMVRGIRKGDLKTPIIILSTKHSESLLLEALKLQLEDYLIKPVQCSELMEALRRSVRGLKGEYASAFLRDDVYYCYRSKQVIYQDHRETLTNNEISLMELFLDRRGCVLYYSEIEDAVWGAQPMSMDALKTMVKNIRKKIPEGSVTNIQGVGYRFD